MKFVKLCVCVEQPFSTKIIHNSLLFLVRRICPPDEYFCTHPKPNECEKNSECKGLKICCQNRCVQNAVCSQVSKSALLCILSWKWTDKRLLTTIKPVLLMGTIGTFLHLAPSSFTIS